MTTEVFRRLDVALDGIDPAGVVHVGAHRGQEVDDYRRAGFSRIVLVEANEALWPALDSIEGVEVFRCAAGTNSVGSLHVTEWDERSSLLWPLEESVVGLLTVEVRPLCEMQEGCNVAVLDVQGSELDVLRSADLDRLDAVIVECCETARYEGAAVTAEVAEFMTEAGWEMTGRFGGHSSPELVDIVWRST